MKYLIQIVKFFNKQQLRTLIGICESKKDLFKTLEKQNNITNDIYATYYRGHAVAYKDMVDILKSMLKEEK